jgi:Mobilization protein NikA
MPSATITFRVDDAERDELVARAERENVNLSDYIRVRLGLRGQGSAGDDEIRVDSHDEQALREQIVDHERRLHVLEEDYAQRLAAREHRR